LGKLSLTYTHTHTYTNSPGGSHKHLLGTGDYKTGLEWRTSKYWGGHCSLHFLCSALRIRLSHWWHLQGAHADHIIVWNGSRIHSVNCVKALRSHIIRNAEDRRAFTEQERPMLTPEQPGFAALLGNHLWFNAGSGKALAEAIYKQTELLELELLYPGQSLEEHLQLNAAWFMTKSLMIMAIRRNHQSKWVCCKILIKLLQLYLLQKSTKVSSSCYQMVTHIQLCGYPHETLRLLKMASGSLCRNLQTKRDHINALQDRVSYFTPQCLLFFFIRHNSTV